MIKKIVGFIAIGFVSCGTFAMQCPPASALHHVKGQNWTLDASSNNWAMGENFQGIKNSSLTMLPVNTNTGVNLRPKAYYKASCYYEVPGARPPEHMIAITNQDPINPANIPTPPFVLQYDTFMCSTTGNNTIACAWKN